MKTFFNDKTVKFSVPNKKITLFWMVELILYILGYISHYHSHILFA